MNSRDRSLSLRHMLDGLVEEQKCDIYALSRGHLNETKHMKGGINVTHVPWCSSERNTNELNKSVSTPRQTNAETKSRQRHRQMQRAVVKFSMPSHTDPKSLNSMHDDLIQSESHQIAARETTAFSKNSRVIVTDSKDRIEDLQKMVNSSCNEVEASGNTYGLRSFDLLPSDVRNQPPRFSGITRREQFRQMKQFEEKLLRKPDHTSGYGLTRSRISPQLETRLQKRPLRSDCSQVGSSGSLELCGDNFTELISKSGPFAEILRNIQIEYENYIGYLLDDHVDRHEVLHKRIDLLRDEHSTNAPLIKDEEKLLYRLEEQIRTQLATNERLREDLGRATRSVHTVQSSTECVNTSENKTSVTFEEDSTTRNVFPSRSEKLDELHRAILEKLEEIKELKTRLKRDYTPVTVCNYLRQCRKETDTEIQKLTSQMKYYNVRCVQLELDMKAAIESADTTDRDTRRIWRKLISMEAISKESELGRLVYEDVTRHPDDDNESSKWNWYIS